MKRLLIISTMGLLSMFTIFAFASRGPDAIGRICPNRLLSS